MFVHTSIRLLLKLASVPILVCSIIVDGYAADYRELSVIGRREITAALDASEITSMNEVEAARRVGRVFVIGEDKVEFGKRICPAPELSAQRVETRLYLRKEAHADYANMGLPNPATVVELGCTIAFIKANDRLVIHWDGWFFDTRRIR